MATNDSDDVADLLEDIDDLDEQLFNRSKKRKDKPELSFQDSKKNEKSGNFLNNIFSEPKISKKPFADIGSTDTTSRFKQTASKIEVPSQQLNNVETASQPQSNFLSFLPSDDSRKAQTASEAKNISNPQHYDRTQRLEKEVDRLNREIDEIKKLKKRDEEELIQEWKEKLAKQKNEYEEMLEEASLNYKKKVELLRSEYSKNLSDLKDTFEEQMHAIQSVQQQSKKSDDVLKKVAELTDHIDAISTKMSTESDRSVVEHKAALVEREKFLQYKEERLAKKEQQVLDDRKLVDELNLKLRTLYDDKETQLLKDKWIVKEERNKLASEKVAFKEDQRQILEALEKEKAYLDESKRKFLAEQQDLLIRVINEKSLLEEEKMAFLAERNSDITRIKDEAQRLDSKIIEVENAERLMSEAKQMYELKYHMPFWNEVVTDFDDVKPVVEVVADPYVSSTKPVTRSDNAKALLQLNAEQTSVGKEAQTLGNGQDVETV
uniref:PH domain-containing protein n=1 Tax=Syphacia muris TaxID=451379 RepID=A0A0N5AFR3_9BILA